MKHRFLILFFVLLLTGCKEILYTALTQADANQMIVILTSNNIGAEKSTAKDGTLSLSVEKNDFTNAVSILHFHGYPKQTYQSVNDIFPSGQLVTSPAQEQVKINYLKEQGMEKMLADIDGVITARVSVSLLANDDSHESTPGSASVFIKYSPDVNMDDFVTQIKSLVHNSMPELSYDSISVVIQPAQYLVPITNDKRNHDISPSSGQNKWYSYIYYLLGGAWVVCLLAIVVGVLRRRKKMDGGRFQASE